MLLLFIIRFVNDGESRSLRMNSTLVPVCVALVRVSLSALVADEPAAFVYGERVKFQVLARSEAATANVANERRVQLGRYDSVLRFERRFPAVFRVVRRQVPMGDEDVVANVAPKRPLPVDFVEMVARRLIVRESGVTNVALDVFRLGGARGRIVNRDELAVDVDVLRRPVIPAMFVISNQFFA